MHSAAEIQFRLRQELANLYLNFLPPAFSGKEIPARLALPEPRTFLAALRDSVYEASTLICAKSILAHRFPLLGITLETGPQIDWRRDYQHNKTSPARYFRRIPYLNFDAVGDHKFIWELNRHQNLVLLAQAYLLTGQRDFLREVFAELESWLKQNPFQKGINWASALEVAFRALSWIWIWHFVSDEMPAELRARFLTGLYQHGHHLAANLSVYFSPNTHLLGEAVALHAIGTLFPAFPEAEKWRLRGAEVVEEQITFQMKPDGSHFEQSTYYHVYAVDFFVFYYLLAARPARMEPALRNMAEYLAWLLGPARRIAFFGDDDGGRLFHPQGKRDEFGRASLATCGVLLNNPDWVGTREDLLEQAVWWLGDSCLAQARARAVTPKGSKVFPDAGAVFLQSSELYVQFDAGPFGWAGAGHSHADTLSLVAWQGSEAVFTDPGTFTYVGNPQMREQFRGTAAHNTVTIDGLNQAQSTSPFRWATKPDVKLLVFRPDQQGGFADAVCEYGGFRHRRRVLLRGGRLIVLDEVEGSAGEHTVEQHWQLGAAAEKVHLSFSAAAEEAEGQYSPAYGAKTPAPAVSVKVSGALPQAIAMLLDTRASAQVSAPEARQWMEDAAH